MWSDCMDVQAFYSLHCSQWKTQFPLAGQKVKDNTCFWNLKAILIKIPVLDGFQSDPFEAGHRKISVD